MPIFCEGCAAQRRGAPDDALEHAVLGLTLYTKNGFERFGETELVGAILAAVKNSAFHILPTAERSLC